MRTIQRIVYQYAELSEDAKEKARNWYREGADYSWSGEAADTLAAFVKALPISLGSYEYGERGREHFQYEVNNDDVLDLRGLRLRAWFINNFWNGLEKGRYQSTPGAFDADGKYQYKQRRSAVQMEVSCPFTGVCFDEDILDPVRKFIFKFNPVRDSARTFREIVGECFDSFAEAVASDIEGQNEDDAVAEMIEANEYEFDEAGKPA